MITLEEFLYNGGTDLQAIVNSVDSAIGIHKGDHLIAVGSLVEGLGSIKSDLDLLLITSRDKKHLPANDHVGLVVGKCVVDILVLPSIKVKNLLSRFDQWSRSPWGVTYAMNFTIAERTLLHRFAVGRVLISKAEDNKFEKIRPAPIHLARLKLHVARQDSRTIQVDMIGYREEGDFRSLMFAAQTILGHVVDALLAGHFSINPLPKWRSRLLEFLPSNWEQLLRIRPTGLTANQRVWELHRAPKNPDRNSCLEHAFRILAFARAVFMWCDYRLLLHEDSTKKPISIPQLAGKLCDTPLPYLDLDVDCILNDNSVTLGRLNDFSQPLDLTTQEGELLLFLDGTTTIQECKLAFRGLGVEQSESDLVDHLLDKLAKANMSVELPT